MNTHYRDRRKIDPGQGKTLGDQTVNDGNRVEIGPTALAFAEWRAAGLALPDLPKMREQRWQRLTDHIVARDYGGLLLFDPLNIRYATDSTNMQLWNTHNPFRAVLICADGYMVMWDYRNAPFLSNFNPLVREARAGADIFYFDRGDGIGDAATALAAEVADLLEAHAPGNTRLAVDKPMIHTLRALEARGLDVHPGEELTERARSVKNAEEVKAMRCAVHACEAAMAVMEDFARANTGRVTENDIWAVLHAENIRRGGEWIETRLLTSGPRTNPWFQECGPRTVNQNEILSFDTDLVGPYGICCDISRTWWLGDGPAPKRMVEAHRHAVEHIDYNTKLLHPGLNIEDYSRTAHRLDDKFQKQKYGCLAHGVGLCDEWPLVAYPDQMVPGAFDHEITIGMCLCPEALVSEEGADFSIKLEEQVLITETGAEMLSSYPYDPRFA